MSDVSALSAAITCHSDAVHTCAAPHAQASLLAGIIFILAVIAFVAVTAAVVTRVSADA